MTITDEELSERIRTSLRAVAGSVDGAAVPRARPARRRLRPLYVAVGAAAAVVPLAAAAVVLTGPEYVDRIPPQHPILAGEADGGRYWLVENTRTDECGQPVTGVELIQEEDNFVGSEWNTTGHGYGDDTTCGNYDPKAWLPHPERFAWSGAFDGDTFLAVYSVNPAVDAVRVTVDGGRTHDVPVVRADGAGFAVVELPEGAPYHSVLVADDEVVPGSVRAAVTPRR